MRAGMVVARFFWVLLVFGLVAADSPLRAKNAVPDKKPAPVWVVFFTAKDCPKCENVRKMIDGLKGKYRIRTKVFRLEKESDLELLRSLEAIHGKEKFSAPLLIVGEEILMGEDRISADLEKEIRRLARAGGAGLPYLGSGERRPERDRSEEPCAECDRRRPPDVRDEWKRIKSVLEGYF